MDVEPDIERAADGGGDTRAPIGLGEDERAIAAVAFQLNSMAATLGSISILVGAAAGDRKRSALYRVLDELRLLATITIPEIRARLREVAVRVPDPSPAEKEIE